MDARYLAADDHIGLAPVDLGLGSERIILGDEAVGLEGEFTPALAHVVTNCSFGEGRAELDLNALGDPSGGVALLWRRRLIIDQPLVDDCLERADRWRWSRYGAALLRRDRRVKRLTNCSPVDAVTLRKRVDRKAFLRSVFPDSFELLHSG